ncbi:MULTISPECIES: helix-turn-helix domain-containing protein [unclassified Rathayibacter]|jgi:transcriptional regulator with XRE-family HTH domain|uniref:helix-turn-helix domain-containing protein n=1 Tax=unclassified Rathayibacter TaxID=2609250 RepID=UPI0011B08E70|nr:MULTISPECIES: helix-turn-helix transcriptional regulator [unclassified Rathayibacter]
MAARTGNGASEYSMRVHAAIKTLMARAGLSNVDFATRTGMTLTYFYARMRGDAMFDTNDLERFAQVLGVKVATIFTMAEEFGEPTADVDEVVVLTNGVEFARRLSVLLPAGTSASDDVAGIPAARLSEMLGATARFGVTRSELTRLTTHFQVPEAFLTELTTSEDTAMIEADLELRRALASKGVEPLAARSLGGNLSPAAIRGIAASIRELRE